MESNNERCRSRSCSPAIDQLRYHRRTPHGSRRATRADIIPSRKVCRRIFAASPSRINVTPRKEKVERRNNCCVDLSEKFLRWNFNFNVDDDRANKVGNCCEETGLKWEKINFGTLSGTLHAKLLSPSNSNDKNNYNSSNNKINNNNVSLNTSKQVFTIGSLDTRIKVLSKKLNSWWMTALDILFV